MELIIAVVLLAVFFILRSSETSKSAAADRELDAWQTRHNEWLSRVADENLESELKDSLYQMYRDYWNAYWDAQKTPPYPQYPKHIMPDHMRTVFDEVNAARAAMGWTAIDENRFDSYLIGVNTGAVILQILLANRGKLRWSDAKLGITVITNEGPTRLERRARLEHDRQLVRYIDGKLREHGVTEPLYYVGYKETGVMIPFGEEDPDRIGTYKWEPSIF